MSSFLSKITVYLMVSLVIFLTAPFFCEGSFVRGVENKPTAQSGGVVKPVDASSEYPSAAILDKLPTRNPAAFIGSAISVLLGIVGSIALVMFAYAGIMWMVSMDGDKKAKASKTLMWSSLGLIVIMASYAMVTFVFNMIK